MSANVVKGELSKKLCAALRADSDGAVERLLERLFWLSPTAPCPSAAQRRGAASGSVIALHGTRLPAGR